MQWEGSESLGDSARLGISQSANNEPSLQLNLCCFLFNINTVKLSQFLSEHELTIVTISIMSSYSDYIMSASSSIADIVSTAGTAAASAAGQVAGQVSQS